MNSGELYLQNFTEKMILLLCVAIDLGVTVDSCYSGTYSLFVLVWPGT